MTTQTKESVDSIAMMKEDTMKKSILLVTVFCTFLAGCGGSTKSELTGVWSKQFSDSKPVLIYTTFSEVDKDGNIFRCSNTSDLRQIIPVSECGKDGMIFKVIDSKNACQTGALGQYCVTYLSESGEIKFPDGSQTWKRSKGK